MLLTNWTAVSKDVGDFTQGGAEMPSLTILYLSLSLSQSWSTTWMWTEKVHKCPKTEAHIINMEFKMI